MKKPAFQNIKILVAGDFHGKFPRKLKKIAKRKDIDLIIALGDYSNADKIRTLIFRYWEKGQWYEFVGMKKAKKLEKECFYSGLKILKELNSLKKPVFIIWGNTDFYKDYATSEPPIIIPGFYEDRIRNMKNIHLIDKKKRKIKGIETLSFGGYVDVTEFIKHPSTKDKKKQKGTLKRYLRDEKRLKNLFLKNKPSKDFIFITHYTPLNIFDKVIYPGSPMNGKHVGFEPFNRIIKKYNPKLVLCGHMHEYQGKLTANKGKTIIINPGYAKEGRFAIVDWPSLNVKFFK